MKLVSSDWLHRNQAEINRLTNTANRYEELNSDLRNQISLLEKELKDLKQQNAVGLLNVNSRVLVTWEGSTLIDATVISITDLAVQFRIHSGLYHMMCKVDDISGNVAWVYKSIIRTVENIKE